MGKCNTILSAYTKYRQALRTVLHSHIVLLVTEAAVLSISINPYPKGPGFYVSST